MKLEAEIGHTPRTTAPLHTLSYLPHGKVKLDVALRGNDSLVIASADYTPQCSHPQIDNGDAQN